MKHRHDYVVFADRSPKMMIETDWAKFSQEQSKCGLRSHGSFGW
jgi:hypothetical protein